MCRTGDFFCSRLACDSPLPQGGKPDSFPDSRVKLTPLSFQTVYSPMSLRNFVKLRTGKANLQFQNVASGQDNRVGPADCVNLKKDVEENKPLPLKALLNNRVLISALNYACLALVDIMLRSVQPVFYATPVELGGLGLPPYMIGRILSVSAYCLSSFLDGLLMKL